MGGNIGLVTASDSAGGHSIMPTHVEVADEICRPVPL